MLSSAHKSSPVIKNEREKKEHKVKIRNMLMTAVGEGGIAV